MQLNKSNNVIFSILTVVLFVLIIIGSVFFYEEPIRKYEETRMMMDTFVTITVYHGDEAKANDAISEAFARIEEIAAIATRFNSSSELSQLNENGVLNNPSYELVDMIETSIKYNSITNGAFDITILPLLNLWSPDSVSSPFLIFNMSQAFKTSLDEGIITEDFKTIFLNQNYNISESELIINNNTQEWTINSGWTDYIIKNEDNVLKVYTTYFWNVNPTKQDEYINNTKEFIGSDKITITAISITLDQGMSLTLDGIAKGYSVDAALKVLKDMGIESALINAGGDIATLGTKPGGDKWNTGLRHPEDISKSIMEFNLSGQAIATSGNYYRYYNESAEVGHIMDPNTGRSVYLCSSATVIAENCTVADILATAVFVIGPTDGVQLVDTLSNVEAVVLGYANPQEITYSSNLNKYTE
jgi:thiamine biosynthesis lipoprotein ApbE